MSDSNNSHDQSFISSMKNVHFAREFFEQHLPDKIKKEFNLNTLKEVKKDSNT